MDGWTQMYKLYPDSKVHGANMGPIWGRQDPCWPHELCYLGTYYCDYKILNILIQIPKRPVDDILEKEYTYIHDYPSKKSK